MTDEQRLHMITDQLILVRDNLFRGMSKSIQKLQARSINEVLELETFIRSAPDLQAELDATNRQVEILSDALAESRREIAALKAVQEPVAWKWYQASVKTSWGHDMVVADLPIDKGNTVSVYCERDQTTKVEAMFNPPATPVQDPSVFGLLFAVEQAVKNGDCPWEIENAFDAYEVKRMEKRNG
jgi:hypothetical protein